MKNIVFILICLLSIFSAAQTLHTDDKGVRIFYKIQQTNQFTFCQGNPTSNKNFSKEKIIIWKVTLGLENGYSGSIVPRGVGIANASVIPNPIKPYSQNYCRYKPIQNYEPNPGNSDQSLFVWPIRDHMVKEIKRGEIITNTAYLYLYEGQTPKLTNWQFLGYRLKKDFNSYDPILNDIVNGPKPVTLLDNKTKEKAKKLEAIYIDKIDAIEIPATKINGISFNATKVASQNLIVVEKIKPANKDTYKTDLNSITNKNVKAIKDTKNNTGTEGSIAVKEIKVANNNQKKRDVVAVKCPGKKASEYKEKSNNSSDLSEQRGYSWLALYYTYTCECEMGSPRSGQLVPVINNVVDSYTANTNGAYGKISKVSKCMKSIKN